MVTGTIQLLRGVYPFPAVVGQDRVKRALLCAAISDELRGVLITGPAGTAKSTVVRSLRSVVPSLRIKDLPLNVSEDRLMGGIDVDHAIKFGEKKFQTGILKEVDGGLLYMDEINLFDDRITQRVLDVMECGENRVEREGVSGLHTSSFALVGTMDPAEGAISPHLLDRFDICVEMDNLLDRDSRMEVLRRRLTHESDPQGLAASHGHQMAEMIEDIKEARERLPLVIVPDAMYETVSRLTMELGVEGHRGDLAMIRTSKALAALDRRDQVCLDDLHEAAALCLQHRRRDPDDEREDTGQSESPRDRNERPEQTESSEWEPPSAPREDLGGGSEEVFSIGDPFVVIDYLKPSERRMDLGKRRGKRGSTGESAHPGRCTTFRIPSRDVTDIALVPTLRAAAPYQIHRRRPDMAIVLESSDFREKVRVSKNGTTLLFLVDASGSMGARRRMVAVKGAILSLLKDAYQKRDAVGLMAFRKDSAELMLPPTKSVDLAYSRLRELPTGGRTPLALGLSKAASLLSSDKVGKDDDLVMVIVSDGKANVPLDDGDAFADAMVMAERLSSLPIRFVVVDTGSGYPRIDRAQRLSKALGGTYFRLEDLNSERLARSIKMAVHG